MRRIAIEERARGGKMRRRYVMVSEGRRTFSGQQKRPRPETRQGVERYPSGQIKHADRGEKPEDAMAVALDARVRHLGVKRKDADDPRLGTALGRLLVSGAISPGQYAAGQRVARVMSLAGILDDVRPAFGVPILARLLCASGRDPYEAYDPDLAWDATEEKRRRDAIMKVRHDYGELTREAWEMESQLETRGAWSIIQRVVLWDDQTAAGGDYSAGLLRCGLNRLVHLWGLRDAR